MQPTSQLLLTRLGAAALLFGVVILTGPDAAGQVLPGPISLTPSTPPRTTVALDPVSGAAITIPASSLDQILSPVGGSRTRQPALRPVSTGVYDADRLLSDGTSLWVLDRKRNHVARLDPQTGMVLTAIAPPPSAGMCQISDFLLESSDVIWIGCGRMLFQIRISTKTVERSVDLYTTTFRMAFVGDKLVVLNHSGGEFAGMLLVYSPSTGARQYTWLYRYSGMRAGPYGMVPSPSSYDYGELIDLEVVGADQVIVTQRSGLTLLFRITNTPEFVTTLLDPRTDGWVDTAYLDGVLWTLNRNTGQLHRIVVATRQVLSTLSVGAGATKLLHTGRILWVLLPDRLVAVSPFTNTKLGEAAVGLGVTDLTFSGAEVVSLDQGGFLRRQ